MNDLVREANTAGFRLEMHIIGDKAADAALTALEAAEVTPERRPILTHCQVQYAYNMKITRAYFKILSLGKTNIYNPSLWYYLSIYYPSACLNNK